MKILKNGKEVKDATVFYQSNGSAAYVQIDGVNYDMKAFEIVNDDVEKKTADAPQTRKKTTK